MRAPPVQTIACHLHWISLYQANGNVIFPISPQTGDANHSQTIFHSSTTRVHYKFYWMNIPMITPYFLNLMNLKCCVSHYKTTMNSHHLQMVKAPTGKLRIVQHEDVIYTERICIKYQSRLNQGSPSLQWDSMRKGGVCPYFYFL